MFRIEGFYGAVVRILDDQPAAGTQRGGKAAQHGKWVGHMHHHGATVNEII